MEGNFSKSYKLENPNFDEQDLVWVSDFQKFSNDLAMPENDKIWLLKNYKKRLTSINTKKILTQDRKNKIYNFQNKVKMVKISLKFKITFISKVNKEKLS